MMAVALRILQQAMLVNRLLENEVIAATDTRISAI
jgi:hypothetical protein